MSSKRPVEVHDPSVRLFISWQEGAVLAFSMTWSVGPLGHEVDKGRSLDDPGGTELEIKRSKFNVPFSNPLDYVPALEHPL